MSKHRREKFRAQKALNVLLGLTCETCKYCMRHGYHSNCRYQSQKIGDKNPACKHYKENKPHEHASRV